MTTSKISRSIAISVSAAEILLIFCATTMLSEVVDQISQGKANVKITLSLVLLYGLCVYLSTICNIGLGTWSGWEKINSIHRNWNQFLPLRVSARQKTQWERFFSSIWDQMPRISEIELGICALIAQVSVVYAALSYRAISQGRYELLIMSVPLLVMNLLANRIGVKSWHQAIQENQRVKADFLGWHQRYFSFGPQAYRAWKLDQNRHFQSEWLKSRLELATSGVKSLWKVQLIRLAAKSLLGDFPFYAGICVFLYLGIIKEISIGSVLFWLTMNELLFRANSNLRQILDRFVELRGLRQSVSLELGEFSQQAKSDEKNSSDLSIVKDNYQIELINGERIHLHSRIGLQQLYASNGSGKSHLLKALTGEDLDLVGDAAKLKSHFKGLRTLLIEPEFESLGFETLEEEVMGPKFKRKRDGWLDEESLPKDLKSEWQALLSRLCARYPLGSDVVRASKGEKAMLSMARALTFMGSIELILVDEVDGPLALNYRELVRKTLEHYSTQSRVIVVSHHAVKPMAKSFIEKGFLLGYDSKNDQGHVVPYVLRANDDGLSLRKPLGNVAEGMMGLLEVCVELLISMDVSFRPLRNMSLTLQCNLPGAQVGGIDSAGLGLVLALVNLKRQFIGEKPFESMAATGHIDLGGGVYGIAGLSKKREAALRARVSRVISPEDVNNVADLEKFLRMCH